MSAFTSPAAVITLAEEALFLFQNVGRPPSGRKSMPAAPLMRRVSYVSAIESQRVSQMVSALLQDVKTCGWSQDQRLMLQGDWGKEMSPKNIKGQK